MQRRTHKVIGVVGAVMMPTLGSEVHAARVVQLENGTFNKVLFMQEYQLNDVDSDRASGVGAFSGAAPLRQPDASNYSWEIQIRRVSTTVPSDPDPPRLLNSELSLTRVN